MGSPESKRAYRFAIEDFVIWYCSEPRLAFSKTVVLRYRIELETRHLAPATINLRLAAVRRLAYEAADTGLLSAVTNESTPSELVIQFPAPIAIPVMGDRRRKAA